MRDELSRRAFGVSAGVLLTSGVAMSADDPKPTEAAFARDYPAPGFKPGWKKPQLNRTLVADFVIFAHSDLEQAVTCSARSRSR